MINPMRFSLFVLILFVSNSSNAQILTQDMRIVEFDDEFYAKGAKKIEIKSKSSYRFDNYTGVSVYDNLGRLQFLTRDGVSYRYNDSLSFTYTDSLCIPLKIDHFKPKAYGAGRPPMYLKTIHFEMTSDTTMTVLEDYRPHYSPDSVPEKYVFDSSNRILASGRPHSSQFTSTYSYPTDDDNIFLFTGQKKTDSSYHDSMTDRTYSFDENILSEEILRYRDTSITLVKKIYEFNENGSPTKIRTNMYHNGSLFRTRVVKYSYDHRNNWIEKIIETDAPITITRRITY
jgi:hypothetical protein